MTGGTGINVGRRTVGRNSVRDIGQSLRDQSMAGTQPTIQKAVVMEVFYNPASLTPEDLDSIAEQVDNPDLVDVLPINAIVGRMVSDGQSLGSPASKILFPLFSSHFQLPVQPGEQVSVIFFDPTRSGLQVGYWIDRVHESRAVEDPNYTHGDRRFDPALSPGNYRTSDQAQRSSEPVAPGFPNGASSPETRSMRAGGDTTQDQTTNPYDQIYSESRAGSLVTQEAVPRYRKRPQDLVLQGVNNALIVLGEDRNQGPEREEGSPDQVSRAGTIDMVVGRGRRLPASDREEPGEESGTPTAPLTITNTRGFQEVDKVPWRRNLQDNPREGDPDFRTDASRIYLSMKTRGDQNFKTRGQDLVGTGRLAADILDPDENGGLPYAVLKSDHVRVVARQSGGRWNTDPEDNGTLRIIKEGLKDVDNAALTMSKDGEVTVIGKQLHLSMHGEGDDQGPIYLNTTEDNPDEPYVLFTVLKAALESVQSQLDTLRDQVSNLTSTLQSAFAAAQATPYSPIVALTIAAGQIPPIASGIQAGVGFGTGNGRDNQRATDPANHSKKVFGA